MQGEEHPAKIAFRDRRELVIARLTDSFARDELALEEFERRIDAAYRSQAEAELDALVADLEGPSASEEIQVIVAKAELVQGGLVVHPSSAPPVRFEPRPLLRALFSNIERSDRMVMAETVKIEAIFGNLELDLRETHFTSGVTELRVKAVFGSVEITVPADITVEVYGTAVFGNFEGTTRMTADPDAPVLRIIGSAILASVVVKTAPPIRIQKLASELRARHRLPP